MKKLIRFEIGLEDLVKRVVSIVICDDAINYPSYLSASTSIYGEESFEDLLNDSMEEEQHFLAMKPDQLLDIDSDRIKLIMNPVLLAKLYKIRKDDLTGTQIQMVRDYWKSRPVQITESGVRDFLVKLKKCNNIQYDGYHDETNEFILDEDGNIRPECIDIIKNLTFEDYRESIRAMDPKYLGDELLVFHPKADWKYLTGEVDVDLALYVKLDVSRTTGNCVAVITFHRLNH